MRERLKRLIAKTLHLGLRRAKTDPSTMFGCIIHKERVIQKHPMKGKYDFLEPIFTTD